MEILKFIALYSPFIFFGAFTAHLGYEPFSKENLIGLAILIICVAAHDWAKKC